MPFRSLVIFLLAFLSFKLIAQDTIQVMLEPNLPGLQIPSDFAGLSYEKNAVNAKIFSPPRASMIGFFKTLGIHSLRLSGCAADQDTFCVNETIYPPGTLRFTKSELDSVFSFAQKTNCKVLLGLNLGGSNNPSLAACEVKYVMQHYASDVLGFEVGNEPDFFCFNKLRPPPYTIKSYESEYQHYYDSIRYYSPLAIFTGPGSSSNYTKWTIPFCNNMPGKFSVLTNHYYVAVANSASIREQVVTLLSQSKQKILLAEVNDMVQCANSLPIPVPFRMTECNTFCNGGQRGVSNAFASSIWALDFMYALASTGCAGVNFHGGGQGTYTVIASSRALCSARPIYYGILAFQVGSRGKFIPSTITNNRINLNIYSVIDSIGSVFITVVNKDTLQNAIMQIQSGSKNYSSADFITLNSVSLTDTVNVSLGGQTVNSKGYCAAFNWQNLIVKDNAIQIKVSAGSATIIRFKETPVAVSSFPVLPYTVSGRKKMQKIKLYSSHFVW
ncbi:MAG: hypothetical protein NTY07_12025 [Bacteroidia bacterium]|nr:hypothetical protein [Bacteroidia bacterium]